MIRRWLASPWETAGSRRALRLIGSEDLIAPEVGFTTARLRVARSPITNAAGVQPGLPAWEAPCEAYPENPLREVPAAVQPGRSRFPRALGLLGREVDSEVAEPHIELNPADAATRGLEDSDAVEVFNDRGSFRTVLRVNEAVRPGAQLWWRAPTASTWTALSCRRFQRTLNPRGYALPFGPMIPTTTRSSRSKRRLVNSHDEARYWH